MFSYQVAFLELNRYQNVGRRHYREEQVRNRHRRSDPEYAQPADVQRMPDHSIEQRGHEAQPALRLSLQVPPHLPQPEQIEMIDRERRH